MALLARFDTPASVRDVPVGSPFYDSWSQYLDSLMGGLAPGDNGGAFYNPMRTDVQIAGEKSLVWMGFPRESIFPANRDNRIPAYVRADSVPNTRAFQNEYFEWQVERNANGKISKITFVTETPEYYEQLWRFDPNAVVSIYRALVNPAVQPADLGAGLNYNRTNIWNTVNGIVHYIQGINTLSAAIGLAKGAVTSAPIPRDNYENSNAGFGTSVDPRVVLDVHMMVRKGLHVSLKEPIGFYMCGWNDAGFEQPNGSPAGNYWKVVRGTKSMAMRLVYEVPAHLGFAVGDMKIGGIPIDYGGQVAEHISVRIVGTAGTIGRRIV